MAVLNPEANPDALAIASGAIIAALVERLIDKGVLTRSEIGDTLSAAMRTIKVKGLNHPSQEAVNLISKFGVAIHEGGR